MAKIKVGIVGGAGYTAGELLRVLINHPMVDIVAVSSTSNSGNPVSEVHDDLFGQTQLEFSSGLTGSEDLVFLCLGHGNSTIFFEQNQLDPKTKVIDMSNDFRLREKSSLKHRHFVYGLPELDKSSILKSNEIANPGCFATAIQLGLLPLAKKKLLTEAIHVSAITGSTGAGRSLSDTSHFSWRSNNVSIYKAFTHQHLPEIKQGISILLGQDSPSVYFVPYRGSFTRGILASVYTPFKYSLDEAYSIYKDYYKESPFVHISNKPVHVKQVVGTNQCILHLEKQEGQLLITSVIDNLVKGASGQAVQNMNLLFGFDETMGLKLRGTQF